MIEIIITCAALANSYLMPPGGSYIGSVTTPISSFQVTNSTNQQAFIRLEPGDGAIPKIRFSRENSDKECQDRNPRP